MKIDVAQESFTAGQFGPSLLGRVDSTLVGEVNPNRRFINIPAQYENGCQVIENFLIKPEGSLISCPGTEFINDAKNSGTNQLFSILEETTQLALLVHADTDFSDSSDYNHTSTTTGTPSLDTVLFQFGPGSASIPTASNSAIQYASHNIFNFQSNDFTIEAWVSLTRLDHSNDHLVFVAKGRPGLGGSNFNGFRLEYHESSDDGYVIGFGWSRSGGADVHIFSPFILGRSGSTQFIQDYPGFENFELKVDEFHHIRVVRKDDTLRMYLDGLEVPTGTVDDPNPQFGYDMTGMVLDYEAGSPVVLGGMENPGRTDYTNNPFDGNIDEVMIINGIAIQSPVQTAAWSTASDFRARLIRFVYSLTDSYIIEMGVGYLRFYTDGAVVEE